MSQPRVSIERKADVAIVSGNPKLTYRNTIGIPSTGQITPGKKKNYLD